MEYRVLGGTGLKVSVLGIGTWQLSGPLTLDGRADGFPDVGREKAVRLIRACGELGINLIDSAEIYGDGEGERRVGEAIGKNRNVWVLVTKFGMRRGPDGKRIVDAHPSTIRKSLENSLKRLRSEYIDVFLYHSPPLPDSAAEGKEILDKLKQEGKLRFYGISSNEPTVLTRLLKRNSVHVVMLSQSLLRHPVELLSMAKQHDLGVLIRGAFEGGRLTGKYFHRNPKFSEQDIRSDRSHVTDYRKYAVYEPLLPPNVTMPVFALRYLMDFATTHCIVLGCNSLENYQLAARAPSLLPLGSETHAALERIRAKLSREPFHLWTLRHIWQRILERVRRT